MSNYLKEFRKSITEMDDGELEALLAGVRGERLTAARVVKTGKRKATKPAEAKMSSDQAAAILAKLQQKGMVSNG